MSTLFPQSATSGTINVIQGKRYVFDGDKWVLSPLLDRFEAELPEVFDELPVTDLNGDTIEGVGRNIHHTFTIKDLQTVEN